MNAKNVRTKEEKRIYAFSIIFHTIAIILIIAGFLVPIFKPLLRIAGESIAKIIIAGIVLFFWFSLGVFSFGFLFMADGYKSFPIKLFSELFGEGSEVTISLDGELILIMASISLILVIFSLIFLSKVKGTFQGYFYKKKRGRRITTIVFSVVSIITSILLLINIF